MSVVLEKAQLSAHFRGLNLKAAVKDGACCYCGPYGRSSDWLIWDQVGVLGLYCEPHARGAWRELFEDNL